MKKGTRRTYFIYWLLVSIICANYNNLIFGNMFALNTYFILWLGSLLILGTIRRKALLIFSTLTIMIGYTSFSLFEYFAPIWFFGASPILNSLVIALLISLLTKDFYKRIAIGISGMCAGEALRYIIIFNPDSSIGSLLFLDSLALVIFILFIFYQYEMVKKWLSSLNLKLTQF